MSVKAPSYPPPAFPGSSESLDFAGYMSPFSYSSRSSIVTPVDSSRKLSLFTSSTKSVGNDLSSSPTSANSRNKQHALRSTLRNLDTRMNSSTTTTTTLSAGVLPPRSDSRQKLHKRSSSGSSLPNSPANLANSHSQFTTPYATYEEPFPDISTTPVNSTPKIKPYLRKISTGKEDPDQGRLDLSKSVSENGPLAGLGIQDFGSRSASDGVQTGRGTPHARTTSVGSQISTGSGSFRPNQPFVHPMRQTPNRPYTPPADVAPVVDDEIHESSDVVPDDDVQLGPAYRNRSMSISSTPQIQAPTPLSQSHTAADLGYVPKLTNVSQTNLSIKSGRSIKSCKSKLNRSRTDTNRSVEFVPTASSRTSLDKAISFVSRRSDPDPQGRDERIRAARRKFEEKEANKDRKLEQEALKRRETELAKSTKRQERQRRKSEVSEKSRTSKPKKSEERRSGSQEDGTITALPKQRPEARKAVKGRDTSESTSGWQRFSTWCQTRVLSCGRKGS